MRPLLGRLTKGVTDTVGVRRAVGSVPVLVVLGRIATALQEQNTDTKHHVTRIFSKTLCKLVSKKLLLYW